VRAYPLTVMNGGINRLRVKGGASAKQLYDLQNAYITNAGSIDPREGTIRSATLTSQTIGLMADNGVFNIFSTIVGLSAPFLDALTASTSGGSGGHLVSGTTYFYEVTAVNATGETNAFNELSVLATGAAPSTFITWSPVAGATSYNLYRGTSSGAENVTTGVGLALAYQDIGFNTTGSPPATNMAGAVTVPAGYALNILSDPTNTSAAPVKIWFAKPVMGFPYVVAQFSDGDIWHYWLQNNGTWTSSTDYTSASIVLPQSPNGLAYQGVRDFPPQPLWTAETVITSGSYVEPNTPTGFAYQAVAVTPFSTAGNSASLLLHFDGSFADSGPYNYPVTANGTVGITTTPVEFGSGALSPGSYGYVSVPIAAGGPLDLSTGNFTVEFWAYYTVGALHNGPLVDYGTNGGTKGFYLEYANAGGGPPNLQVNIYDGSSYTGNIGGNLSTIAQWYAFAFMRNGTEFSLYVNGVQSTASPTGLIANNLQMSSTLNIGGGTGSEIDTSPGVYIDEFRVTKGVALYTSNYTPTGPFANAVVSSGNPHTGAAEPVWPTVAGGIIQEFGDFDVSSTDAGTTQGSGSNSPYSTATALGATITDRYGDSATISNSGIYSTSSTLSTLTLASTKVTTWKAGTTYAPGSVVVPGNNQGAFINAIPNGDFEGGSAAGGWTFTNPGGTASWAFDSTLPYQPTEDIAISNTGSFGAGGAFATMTSYGLVTPGQSVTASAYLNPNNAGANLTLWLQLNWYDDTDTLISTTGDQQNEQEGGGYRKVVINGTAPANAAHVRVAIGAGSGTSSRNAGYADLVTWNLATPAPITNFLFEAVQANPGVSGANQPTWPTILGDEIIDGTVTWEAIGTSIITWQAIPLMQSGLTAPTFPTTIGNTVHDFSTYANQNGYVTTYPSMSWEAIDRHIIDTNCPQQIPTAVGASHVFNGDNDITNYSAAVNPIDWSSTNNAGYLPTGLNNYGDNPVAVLALYRSNLMVFNAGGYQMWQIDPDPQNMALLDAQPIGSIWPQAAQSVANDLLFLTEVGVRNLGTVGPTANMAVGNTGQPVDPLVVAQMQSGIYTGIRNPLSIYYPGRGQYMLFFGNQAFVLTINGTAGTKSWSRYLLPQAITDATLNEGSLYLRTTGNLIWQLNAEATVDDANTVIASASNVPFNGVIQWPYMDMGNLGIQKMLLGLDLVGTGNCNVQVAYNQQDQTTFNDNALFTTSTGVTTPYFISMTDIVPGQPIPFPINAPSFSMILTFTGSSSTANNWSWDAANFYLMDESGGGATG
jgi:hypothetical protein